MAIINYHMHSTGSDGQLSPEENILLAIKLGLKFICFTDHYKDPPNTQKEWGVNFHSEEYIKEIKKLKEKYNDKIDISFGAEYNWITKKEEWIKNEIKKEKYDFLIGSVHGIYKNNKYFVITSSEKSWSELLDEFKDIKEIIKEYYKEVREMANSKLFDSVGHLDVVKIWTDNEFQKEKWYKQEIIKTLRAIKTSGMCIEINTSGWKRARCKEQYPSLWILKEIKKMDIPITIGADSHFIDEIDYGLDKALEIAKELGYKKVMRFKDRKPIETEI